MCSPPDAACILSCVDVDLALEHNSMFLFGMSIMVSEVLIFRVWELERVVRCVKVKNSKTWKLHIWLLPKPSYTRKVILSSQHTSHIPDAAAATRSGILDTLHMRLPSELKSSQRNSTALLENVPRLDST